MVRIVLSRAPSISRVNDPHLLPEEVLREKVDGDHAQEPRAKEEGLPELLFACHGVSSPLTAGSPVEQELHGSAVQDQLDSYAKEM